MSPEDQLEFQKAIAENRFRMIQRCDELLEKFLTNLEDAPEHYDAISKIGGLRCALYRELLEVASLTRVSADMNAYDSDTYQEWLDLVKKGTPEEQNPNAKEGE